MTTPAIVSVISGFWCGSKYDDASFTARVVMSSERNRLVYSQSPQTQVTQKIDEAATTGSELGRKICQKMRNLPQPSTSAASSSSRGILRKNCRNRKM